MTDRYPYGIIELVSKGANKMFSKINRRAIRERAVFKHALYKLRAEHRHLQHDYRTLLVEYGRVLEQVESLDEENE